MTYFLKIKNIGFLAFKQTDAQITSADSTFCFQPKEGGCIPEDDTTIVLRREVHCNTPESDFVFNPRIGSIIHKCSGKPVCLQHGIGIPGTKLVVSSTCRTPEIGYGMKRTYCKFPHKRLFHYSIMIILFKV